MAEDVRLFTRVLVYINITAQNIIRSFEKLFFIKGSLSFSQVAFYIKNIQKHLPYHIKDYNTKVEYLSRTSGAKTGLPIPQITNIIQNYTNSETKPIPVTPRTDVQELNDREIATAYLLTLKRAGREYAWSAMEASNPEIRMFLEDAFKMSSHHAYDVWQWMVQKGYYPLESVPAETLGLLGSMYNIVEQSGFEMKH